MAISKEKIKNPLIQESDYRKRRRETIEKIMRDYSQLEGPEYKVVGFLSRKYKKHDNTIRNIIRNNKES
jgi:hypothetical protein